MVDGIHLVNWGIIMTGELVFGQSCLFLHIVAHTLANISMATGLAVRLYQNKAILHSVRTGRSGDRISVGARFSAPVQTGPGAHPASNTMDMVSLSHGAKRPGRGVDHPRPSSTVVEGRVELYIDPTLGLRGLF